MGTPEENIRRSGNIHIVNYWGITIREGAVRWAEEDKKNSGGLLEPLSNLLDKEWTSIVVLNHDDLTSLANTVGITVTTAMNWAELYFYRTQSGSFREGGANIMEPGSHDLRRMDQVMEDRVRDLLSQKYPESRSEEGWDETAPGMAAVKEIWALPAWDFCKGDNRLLLHIEEYEGGEELPLDPTARQVYSALKRHAGEFCVGEQAVSFSPSPLPPLPTPH